MSTSTSDAANPSKDGHAVPAAAGKRKRATSSTTAPPEDTSAESVSYLLGDRTEFGLFLARIKSDTTTPTRYGDVSRWPKVNPGSAGYDHSCVPNLSMLDVEMPSWLTENQLPSLPVVSDPSTLIAFYECRNPVIPITTHPRFKDAYSPAFITTISGSIIAEFFGEDNKSLINIIAADWVSNRNWMSLAVSYRLDRYVGWATRNYLHLLRPGTNLSATFRELPKKLHDSGTIKYWADIWEAWWACIFRERELWNEGIEDIKSIFRRLIFFKYQKILNYSTWNWALESPDGVLKVTEKDVTGIEVLRTDLALEECLGPSTEQTKNDAFGYIAKLAIDMGKRDITVFAASKNDAVGKILEFANSAIPRLLPPIIECMEIGSIQQMSFEAIVKNWFGQPIPLAQPALRSAYTEIQNLQQTLIDKSSNTVLAFKEYTKQFAILFFYEATLAFYVKDYSAAMTAVLCVILFCVLERGRYTNLLHECISYHDKILVEVKRGNTLSKLKPSNFRLKISENRIQTSGKLMIEDRELSWGESSVDISIMISLHVDIRGPTCFPDIHRAHDNLRNAFLFLTSSWYH